MKRAKTSAVVTAVALLLFGAGHVRAEVVDFSYSWSISPNSVLSSGTGTVNFALAGADSSSVVLNGASGAIPAAYVTTDSTAGGQTSPDVFKAPFSLTLHLTDTTSSQSADLTFSGTVSGELTKTTSTLGITFADPVTQQASLGGRLFTASIDPVAPSIPFPGSTSPLLVDALISAASDRKPTATPEPSALALSGSALLILGLARRRLRKR